MILEINGHISSAKRQIKNSISIEIYDFLLIKYMPILKMALTKNFREFKSDIYAVSEIEERKIASIFFKDISSYFHKYISHPRNSFNEKTSYLKNIAEYKFRQILFIERNQDMVDNYLIGNDAYFNDELLNKKYFDDFYDMELRFLMLTELNNTYKFDPFNLPNYQLDLFYKKNSKYKSVFTDSQSFIFFNKFILEENPERSKIISMVVFLKNNDLINGNNNLIKDFILEYYNIDLIRITNLETNENHQEMIKIM